MSDSHRAWPDPSRHDLLAYARSQGVLSPLDQQFADRLSSLYGEQPPGVRWALALACRQEAAGHVCADLRRLEAVGLSSDSPEVSPPFSLLASHVALDSWIEEIGRSALVEVVADGSRAPSEAKPLVLDANGRLYLRRSFECQRTLAELVRARARAGDFEFDPKRAEAGIERFVADAARDDEAPAEALRMAIARPLAIVTGGPGTGKTTLVARLVALLVEQAVADGSPPPRVRLLAPTGKAATAMTAAFARQREALDLAAPTRDAMDPRAETIHRALFRQTRLDALGRPADLSLDADLVVVDEASMVDLESMTRLFAACRSVPRLVLLGDPAQLASVDSGAVLAELCGGPGAGSVLRASRADSEDRAGPRGLADSIVRLRTSHRYREAGGIGRLADAIQSGEADRVVALLEDPSLPEIGLVDVASIEAVRARLVEASRDVHREIGSARALDAKLERMGLYRVLCAHRRGPLGVEALCAVLDEAAATERHTTRRAGWWLGRLLLITQNAPDQDLWNGDVGLIEETPSGLRAIFPDSTGGVRSLTAGRLPSHESAIAMSVHKSQGSEFDVVDLVLGGVTSRLMTRELLYTGVTRARKRLRIHASEAVVRDAVERRVSRDSGLGELLWDG